MDITIFIVNFVWVCWMPKEVPPHSVAQAFMLLRYIFQKLVLLEYRVKKSESDEIPLDVHPSFCSNIVQISSTYLLLEHLITNNF